jgi:hypothetical protein
MHKAADQGVFAARFVPPNSSTQTRVKYLYQTNLQVLVSATNEMYYVKRVQWIDTIILQSLEICNLADNFHLAHKIATPGSISLPKKYMNTHIGRSDWK